MLVAFQGPAHDKTYSVSLIIGEEKYLAQGKSIKKAKQNAAILLFENTNYVPIPSKDKFEKIDESVAPTVLLNNVCMQFGIKVEYSVLDKEHVCVWYHFFLVIQFYIYFRIF